MTEGQLTTTTCDGAQLTVKAHDDGTATIVVAGVEAHIDPLTAAQLGDMLVSRAVSGGRPVPIGLLDAVCARAVIGAEPPYAPDRFGVMPDRPTSADDERSSPWLDVLRRHEPGTMQQHPGLPVHACRAVETVHIGGAEHAVSMPLCDDAARGVVTTDRSLVDCDACIAMLAAQQPSCPNRCNDGYVERAATPAEVDAGFELGVAFDPCPSCNPQPAALTGVVDGPPCLDPLDLPQPGEPTVDLLNR